MALRNEPDLHLASREVTGCNSLVARALKPSY
jgi:hypothetical protein